MVQPTLLENLATTNMAKTEKKTFRWQAYKPLLATGLAIAGLFNMVGAVVAEGTLAGTPISNTATATYDDGTGTPPIDAVSNTVTINVAEVAGLTVTSSGFDDDNGGSIVEGDTLFYDFLVTNTGNAPTYVFVPGANNIGVTNGNITSVDIVNPTTGAVIEAIDPAGESTQGGALDAIAVDTGFTVRVTVTAALDNPAGGSTGQSVEVRFGDTTDNTTAPGDGSPDQQNIPDDTDGTPPSALLNDVRTENETTVSPLAPANGEREAAASRAEAFNTAPANLAQVRLLKTSAYSDATPTATPLDPSDDTIVYSLELEVGNDTLPTLDPGSLEGTNITLDGTPNTSRVLISDAIPANTIFQSGTLTATDLNWTPVYSETPLTTDALQADWSTTEPATLANITRVGFVYDAATDGALAPATTVTGFSFGVTTNGLVAPGGSIANVAQVFGESEGDPGDNVVFDESGDPQYNNLNLGDDPADNTTTFDPVNDLGVGNVADPEETLNDNDGTGPDGESNVVTITTTVAGDLFNGPNGAPDATGPTNTNDDFTNVTTTVPVAGAPGTPTDPAPVTITNEVQNPVGAPTRLDTVTLLPLAPESAGPGVFGTNADLPDLTRIQISFGGQQTAYEYSAGVFTPIVSLADNTPATGADADPVVIGTLQPGDRQTYTVEIDLPDGTEQVAGFGVPIVAFVDNDGNGEFTPVTETVSNVTVDRVYTGFIELVKQARVIFAPRDGVTPPPTAFSSDQAVLDAIDMRPGDEIEYQISYENISEPAPAAGVNNVILNANNFVLTEDGTQTTNTVDGTGAAITVINNWAATTTHQQGTVATSGPATVSYIDLTGPTLNADPADDEKVDVYVNTVGIVTPGTTGSLTFLRQVD